MQSLPFLPGYYPNTPQEMKVGELTYKIIQKDHVKKNGCAQLYLQCFSKGQRVLIPVGIEVPPIKWNSAGQEIKGKSKQAIDFNLIIGESKKRAHNIIVDFKLSRRKISLALFKKEFLDPTPNISFYKFYEYQLKLRLTSLKHGTHRQQSSTLTKLKMWRSEILFSEFDFEAVQSFKGWMRKKKNSESTIGTALKNLKCYLNLAEQSGITLAFDVTKIEIRRFEGLKVNLTLDELKRLQAYYNNEFCIKQHKQTLQYFLFSCFTGLRFGDIELLTQEHIFGEYLSIVPEKTRTTSGNVLRLLINSKAKVYLNEDGPVFNYVYCNNKTNVYLKEIARQCGITKKLSYHISRHTFATIFLQLGGRVEILQKLMGHSKITQTMEYTHIVSQERDDAMRRFEGV